MSLLKRTAKRIKQIFGSAGKVDPHSDQALDELQKRINYRFKNRELLRQSLTHRSCVNSDSTKNLISNERLEFLGDAVLNCLVTENIYIRYPEYTEGQLSKIKSLLVSRKIMAEIARSIELGPHLIMGRSEKKSGGQKRFSIISNAFEALLGALYLDGGIDSVRNLLGLLLFTRMDHFIHDEHNVNYKSKILEMAQGDGFGVPQYVLLSEEGPDHAKKFKIGIAVAGIRLGEGFGSNKKEAQQNAAYNALPRYNKEYILSQSKGE